MSFSTSQSNGECSTTRSSYNTSDDQYLSYIVTHDWVTMVASTGNSNDLDGGNYMCSPSSSPNVIAVGSVTDGGLNSHFSNYSSVYTTKATPLLVAPGESFTIDNITGGPFNGTSLSAPLVSGSIALLMQNDSDYKILVNGVMSNLAASANYDAVTTLNQDVTRYSNWTVNSDGSVTVDPLSAHVVTLSNIKDSKGMYTRSGAGMLDAFSMFSNYYSFNEGICIVGVINSYTSSYVFTKTIYIPAGKNLSIGLGVMAYDNTQVGNYDIQIYNSSGTLLWYTYGGKSVVKKLTSQITSSGYYTIKIIRKAGALVGTLEDLNYSIIVKN